MNDPAAPLEFLEMKVDLRDAPGDAPDGAPRGAPEGGRSLTAVLLHGFGAGPGDLLPLAPLIGVAHRWYAPQAPVPIMVEGTLFGRAWFPREERELRRALYGEYFLDLPGMDPPGLTEAAWAVRSFITERGLDPSRVVVIGFSQGAMVAAEMLRQGLAGRDRPFPAAAVLLSGALVAAERWSEGNLSAGDGSESGSGRESGGGCGALPPVLQAHGTQDRILPFREGEALRETLEAVGFPLQWYPFEGDHAIPEEVVRRIRAFMTKIIENLP
ncbi:MAG: hypothetical protein EA427_08720 [Spirochaetaceae bacterium]|nr:MAG: hypothetical protein EA427_08720 [Spirochaetaceae bacterium]